MFGHDHNIYSCEKCWAIRDKGKALAGRLDKIAVAKLIRQNTTIKQLTLQIEHLQQRIEDLTTNTQARKVCLNILV